MLKKERGTKMELLISIGLILILSAYAFVKSQIIVPRVSTLQSGEEYLIKASSSFCQRGITFEWKAKDSGEVLKKSRIRCCNHYSSVLGIHAPVVDEPTEVVLKVKLAYDGILQVITSKSRIYTIFPSA